MVTWLTILWYQLVKESQIITLCFTQMWMVTYAGNNKFNLINFDTYIIIINLIAENRNTVFSRKYFQTPELLNFPFNWGLEITRIFVFYLHLKLVESANWGLNFFCFVCDRCSKFIKHQWPHVLWRKGFYFYERGV